MAAAVTVSISGACYAALNPTKAEESARAVANQATCRTVDTAIVAYVGVHGVPPRSVTQLREYVKGDISKYRIVDGTAAGPGC